jgi:sulfotransferase
VTSNYHFISGLPRSGSTLLSAILRQNPRFRASTTSPVASLWGALMPKMSGKSEFASFFDDDRRSRLLKGVMSAYYGETPSEGVIFDTNRSWTAKASLIGKLYPNAKIICCVRDIGWIIDSIERMLRRNALQTSKMFNFEPGSSVYERIEILMNSEKGLIGLSWSSLRELWFSDNADRLLLIDYDQFVRAPKDVIRRLYAELAEPGFDHDFGNIVYDEPDYDVDLGMPGLHTVHKRVEPLTRRPCIPPDIFDKYAGTRFWANPKLNRNDARILS